MHFEESDEEKIFRDSVHEFAQRYVALVCRTYDGKTHKAPGDLVVEQGTTPISSQPVYSFIRYNWFQ